MLVGHREVLVFRNSTFAVPLLLLLLGRVFGQDFFAACSCCLPLCSTGLLASWELPQRRGRDLWGKEHLCTGHGTLSYCQHLPEELGEEELLGYWCEELLSFFLPHRAHPWELSWLVSPSLSSFSVSQKVKRDWRCQQQVSFKPG